MSTLDFFASNEAQKTKSSFQDDRFNTPIQWLKFPPDMKGQRIDILPMSDKGLRRMLVLLLILLLIIIVSQIGTLIIPKTIVEDEVLPAKEQVESPAELDMTLKHIIFADITFYNQMMFLRT